MSFVWGDDRIEYLRKRRDALVKSPLFYGMEYSTDPARIRQWAPLLMEGRDASQKVAATYMPLGTDVNFAVITNQLTQGLQRNPISSCNCSMRSPRCARTAIRPGTSRSRTSRPTRSAR